MISINITTIWKFIKKYYIDSIVYKQGYNVVNTITWAIILLIAVVYIYKFLEKRVSIDEKFVYSNIPFIVFGSSLRIFEDAGFVKPPYSYLLMSPMIYVIVFSITFTSLILSLRLKGNRYYRYHALIGLILAIITLFVLFFNLRIVNAFVIPLGLAFSVALTLAFATIALIEKNVLNKLSFLAFFSHMFDASETYIGITKLGYWELHVLPRFLIERFGAESLIIVKFFVLLVILYVLDKSTENSAKNFTKFVLIVLGLAPALRDGLRLSFNV